MLHAKVVKAVAVAKRKGDKWLIGAMTNNVGRIIEVNLNFLNNSTAYKLTSFEDGINTERQVLDYRKRTTQVKSGDILKIKMARNGGFAAVIE